MISQKIHQAIREVPDFPKPGINFKDITTLLLDSKLSSNIIDDSTYAVINSDSFNPYIKYNPDELPTDLVGEDVGFITEPTYENGSISIKKLSKIDQDAQEKARAKHILLRFDDSNKSTVRTEANRILNLLRSGSDFEETARTYSQDGSASNGGDLGWFTDGMMVKPFQDAVFSRRRSGLIPRIIETDFGFHIINVTYPKTRTSYFVANISKDILPSDNTRNNIYRSAELFKLDIKSTDDVFSDYLKENNIIGGNISDIDKNSTEVGTIPNARNVILWSYSDDRYVGEVSDVLETDEGYIVAQINEMKDEGTKKLDDVENSVKKKLLDDKKFEYVNDLLKEYSSLDDLKSIYEKGEIYNMSNIDFNTNSIQNVGFSPEAIGVAFSLSEGELTKPIKIDDGIIVLNLNSISQADSLNSYSDFGISLLQANKFTSSLKVDKAIKEFSKIEDLRYKFF